MQVWAPLPRRTPGDNASRAAQALLSKPAAAGPDYRRESFFWQRREELIRSKNQSFCMFFEPNGCAQKPEQGCETYMHSPKTQTFRYLHQKVKVLKKKQHLSCSLPNVRELKRSQITKVWSVCNSGAPVIDSLMSRQTSKHVLLSLGSPSLFHRRDGEKMMERKAVTPGRYGGKNLGIF